MAHPPEQGMNQGWSSWRAVHLGAAWFVGGVEGWWCGRCGGGERGPVIGAFVIPNRPQVHVVPAQEAI